MPRPKAGTPEGDIAKQKFRETMEKKYGSMTEYFRTIGAKGGAKSRGGGFAQGEAGRERAKIAGAKGGRISKRSKAKGSQ